MDYSPSLYGNVEVLIQISTLPVVALARSSPVAVK
jgi:hypothetical protein